MTPVKSAAGWLVRCHLLVGVAHDGNHRVDLVVAQDIGALDKVELQPCHFIPIRKCFFVFLKLRKPVFADECRQLSILFAFQGQVLGCTDGVGRVIEAF